jgi:hypothetical protein
MTAVVDSRRRSRRTLIEHEIGVLIRLGQCAGAELTKEGNGSTQRVKSGSMTIAGVPSFGLALGTPRLI